VGRTFDESGGQDGPVDDISTGQQATVTHTVGEADTALAVGSGDLPVLGTPRLLAWAEEATCAALAAYLPAERSSVGTRVQLEHVGASPVGAEVRVSATVVYSDGRLVRFEVVAEQGPDGKVVGHGEVTRVVVDRDRFLSRLG
jgi:predicted thioesterase